MTDEPLDMALVAALRQTALLPSYPYVRPPTDSNVSSITCRYRFVRGALAGSMCGRPISNQTKNCLLCSLCNKKMLTMRVPGVKSTGKAEDDTLPFPYPVSTYKLEDLQINNTTGYVSTVTGEIVGKCVGYQIVALTETDQEILHPVKTPSKEKFEKTSDEWIRNDKEQRSKALQYGKLAMESPIISALENTAWFAWGESGFISSGTEEAMRKIVLEHKSEYVIIGLASDFRKPPTEVSISSSDQ